MRKKKKRNNKAKIYYVYDLKNARPFESLNPIYEAIESILGDNLFIVTKYSCNNF